jgi:chorismate lyase
VKQKSLSRARWHFHVNATAPSSELREWLTTTTSLTARLREHSDQFRVRRLRQRQGLCLADESRVIGLPRRMRAQEREVLLYCDGKPVVFAHTVIPLSATASDWPIFRSLGESSLGTSLFGDPAVTRGPLQFSRLPLSHPLMQRIRTEIAFEQIESRLHARRCLFRRGRGVMLVTEVFLPCITGLQVHTLGMLSTPLPTPPARGEINMLPSK